MKNQDEGNYSVNDNQYPKVGIFIIKTEYLQMIMII
mgnify:FL=1